jgi:hypothetical protein
MGSLPSGYANPTAVEVDRSKLRHVMFKCFAASRRQLHRPTTGCNCAPTARSPPNRCSGWAADPRTEQAHSNVVRLAPEP